MKAPDFLQKFERNVRAVLQQAKTEEEIVVGIRPLLKSLLVHEEWLPENYQQPLSDQYASYLVYKPDDEAFAVIAFVWGPGQSSPVHDHLVWGVVGVWKGTIEEARFRPKQKETDGATIVLEQVETVTAHAGDVSHVYPPSRDIHRVSNPFDSTAITLHVYGADIGSLERNVYDLATGKIRKVITGHQNQRAIYS
jgi:predicted metal-dependent enzyme (double-stranded beta helix superfamily)